MVIAPFHCSCVAWVSMQPASSSSRLSGHKFFAGTTAHDACAQHGLDHGAPVGCVLVSPTHVYPGPVGVDIKCSMSLLQLDLPEDAVADKTVRRALINAIVERTPTGAGKGQRNVKKGRTVNAELGRRVAIEGASVAVCNDLGIPPEWAAHCEDAFHVGHSNQRDDLAARLDLLIRTGKFPKFEDKIRQLGSYGGGNHFGEYEAVQISDNDRARRETLIKTPGFIVPCCIVRR